METEKVKSDFRYDTGEARVPWNAVGENINIDDLLSIVNFLIPSGKDQVGYEKQFLKVKEEIEKLSIKGKPVAKLSLGNQVKNGI